MRIGVISDIHSNAFSLKIALKELLNHKINQCIILGDLLTYGTQPNEVIELLMEFSNMIECIFIKGNHEEFYFDIENNINPIKYKMPEFVQESIFWTNRKLKYKLSEIFDWNDNYIINNIYFAHANPFEYGDWTYMNKEEDILRAAITLNDRNMNIGIFGHTHRNKNYLMNSESSSCELCIDNNFNLINNTNKLILNIGSLGQPRGSSPNIMIVNIENNIFNYINIQLNVNNKLIIDETVKTTLSMETKNKLNSFWEKNNG